MPDDEQPASWPGRGRGGDPGGVAPPAGRRVVGVGRTARPVGTGRGPWGPRRGFGCLFALLFLFVAGSLVAGSAYVLSHLGRFPGCRR